MRNVEAQLIHDMQNTALVLREAASQLHENDETLPPGVVAHLTEMLMRRSDMLVRLLGDLSTCHLAEHGELDLAVVLADPMRITQVLDNLVTNALRYGGPNVQMSASRDATSVSLTVSDDGPSSSRPAGAS